MITITITIQQKTNEQAIEVVEIYSDGKGDNPTPREAHLGNTLKDTLREALKKTATDSGGFVVGF